MSSNQQMKSTKFAMPCSSLWRCIYFWLNVSGGVLNISQATHAQAHNIPVANQSHPDYAVLHAFSCTTAAQEQAKKRMFHLARPLYQLAALARAMAALVCTVYSMRCRL